MILQNAGNGGGGGGGGGGGSSSRSRTPASSTNSCGNLYLTDIIKFTAPAKLCLFLSVDSGVAVTWTSKNVQQM